MILIIVKLFRAWRSRQVTKPVTEPVMVAAGRQVTKPGTEPVMVAANRLAASRGPAALLIHQTGYDLRASFRNPRARFFTFFFPVLLLLIFASVFGHGTTVVDGVTVKLSRFYVPGILAMSIITAAYGGLVVSVATARETGVLKRRRATPAPAAVLVCGQALSTLVITVIMATILLVIARFGYHVGIAAGGLGAIAITVLVGTLAFACLGYAVAGMIGSVDAAQPIVQATTMPLYFISGVWIPTQHLGSTLRSLAAVFPVQHLAAALHLASVRGSFTSALSPQDLAVLAVWAIGALGVAAWRFSWLPSTAAA